MLANIITSCRIILSVIMLFFPAFSTVFYSLYLTAGFTDMIDGTVARKLGTNSEFGSKLDTFSIVNTNYIAIAVCAMATFAALQESYIIRTSSQLGRLPLL